MKGVKSIQHYALNRPDLVKERTKEVKRFANELVGIEETFEECIKIADKLLYEAKEKGRNRVIAE